MSYLKKILGELAMVLDQIEAELEKRKLENEGGCQPGDGWGMQPTQPSPSLSSSSLFSPSIKLMAYRLVGIMVNGVR